MRELQLQSYGLTSIFAFLFHSVERNPRVEGDNLNSPHPTVDIVGHAVFLFRQEVRRSGVNTVSMVLWQKIPRL